MNAQSASRHIASLVSEASQACRSLCGRAGFVFLLLFTVPAMAATAPALGPASTYAIASSTFSNSNTAPQSIINGTAGQPAVCYTTLSTGLPMVITGTIVVPCPAAVGVVLTQALANLNTQAADPGCTFLDATPLEAVVIGSNPAGTFPPGCYTSAGAMNVTANGIVTLKGAGVYVFSPGGALNTGADSSIVLAGGACASDVYWAPVGATTIGANSGPSLVTPTFQGNILDAAGITIGQFANLTGRALTFGGTVLTDANTITVPVCASSQDNGGVPTAVPAVSGWTMIMLTALLASAGIAAMRRRLATGKRRKV